jgi:hypothetical protein
MNWMVTTHRLDPEQRIVLDNLLRNSTSHWIRGFAGSGKSILLVHSLRETLLTNPQATACVVAFTHSLKDMLQSGLPDNSKHVPVMTYHEFKSAPRRYDYIFVDEVQDLEPSILTLLKGSCSKLIMAGDEEQSIYEQRVSPDFIHSSTSPTVHSLSVVHRLTEKLRKIVATILPTSKVHSARQGKPTADVKITLASASNHDEEMRWVWENAQRFTRLGDPVCILFSKHRLVQKFIAFVCNDSNIGTPSFTGERGRKNDYDECNELLESKNVMLRYLGNSHGRLIDSDTQRIVYIMTYHSSKGLDFETVFLPGLDENSTIFNRNDEAMDRRLFYVAATRSRRNLFISYTGKMPHPFVTNELDPKTRPAVG